LRVNDGRLLSRLKGSRRDGTTHVVFESIDLVENLAAIVPVLPKDTGNANKGRELGDDCPHGPRCRSDWATLMQRVFAVDVLECPRCGGKMRILATIHPPEATIAILESLGVSPAHPL